MKKAAIFVSIVLTAILLFVSCGEQSGNDPTAAPTAEPTAVQSPSATPETTATPEPTSTPEPTPVPEPGTYDLMNFEPDEDHIFQDGWDVLPDMWAGPLQEPGRVPEGAKADGMDIFGHREIVAVEYTDGSIVGAVRLAIDGDEGQRWLGNRYGISECGIKANTKYRVEATFMLSGSNLDNNISVLGYATNKEEPDQYIEITAKDEWQTVTYEFTTGKDISTANIVLGPRNWAGHCNYDYELLISKCELYEVIGGEEEEDDSTDLLNFKPSKEHFAGDTWSISEGKFCGPLEAPDAGTENEAMRDGKKQYASRGTFSTTLSDGSTGMVIRHVLLADEGYRNSGNFYGISGIGLKGNTTYVLTVVLKYTGEMWEEGEAAVVGFVPKTSDLKSSGCLQDFVVLEAKDEWQTITLEFTTPEEVTEASIAVGPDNFIGKIKAGYCMMIESMKLVEKTE